MQHLSHRLVPLRQQQLLHEAEQARVIASVRRPSPRIATRLQKAFSLRPGLAW